MTAVTSLKSEWRTVEYRVAGADPMKGKYCGRDFAPNHVTLVLATQGGVLTVTGIGFTGPQILKSGAYGKNSPTLNVSLNRFDHDAAMASLPEWARNLVEEQGR